MIYVDRNTGGTWSNNFMVSLGHPRNDLFAVNV